MPEIAWFSANAIPKLSDKTCLVKRSLLAGTAIKCNLCQYSGSGSRAVSILVPLLVTKTPLQEILGCVKTYFIYEFTSCGRNLSYYE